MGNVLSQLTASFTGIPIICHTQMQRTVITVKKLKTSFEK
jgi:hypothetical protein